MPTGRIRHYQSTTGDLENALNKALSNLDVRDYRIDFVTSTVPDERSPGRTLLLQEAYVTYWGAARF